MNKNTTRDNTPRRSKWALCGGLAILGVLLIPAQGCNDQDALDAFRGAASSNLQAGVNSLMDGFVDGVFAVIDLGLSDPNSSSAASTTAATP